MEASTTAAATAIGAPQAAAPPDLANLKRMFEEASSSTSGARRQSEIDRDYFDNIQWTEDEKRVLKRRKQPDNTFNYVKLAVNGMLGVLEQNQTDPKAYGRNPNDDDAADIATKTMRYVEDRTRLDDVKRDAATDFLVEGTCAALVEPDEQRELNVTLIHWSEFFADPHCRRRDFKDARYMGIAKWQWADDVKAAYPNSARETDNVVSTLTMGDGSFDDRPSDGAKAVGWSDPKRKRLLVIELYHREGGEWARCVFHGGGVLDYGPSPYLDDRGRTKCPIEAACCYIDRENNRYGVVREMRGAQDEINKRHSKALHLLNTRQIQEMREGAAAVEADVARAEAARPDGVMPPGWGVVPTNDMLAGQVEFMAIAQNFIARFSPSPAVLGREGENASGKSNLIRQQAGLTELAPILGVFDGWLLRIYRSIWEGARQFWTGPKFLRVTEDPDSVEFVGINQPVMTPTGPAVANPIAQMDVDITIETTQHVATLRQEMLGQLMELAGKGLLAGIPPLVLMDIVLSLAPIPDRKMILDKLKAAMGQPDPAQQMAQKLALEAQQADIANTKSDTALNEARTHSEILKPSLEAARLAHEASEPAAGDTGDRGSFPPR